MEILEKIFLSLSIFVPSIFIIMILFNFSKVKASKKSKVRLTTAIIASFLINFSIYEVIKISTEPKQIEKKEFKEETKEPINKIEEPKEDATTTTTTKEATTTITTTTTKKASSEEKTSNGFKIVTKNGATYVDGYLIVNKTYPLSENYIPTNTHKKITSETICADCIVKDAYDAFAKMKEDAKKEGLTIWIQSGYRSYSYQNSLYNKYVKEDGQEKADTYSARPGHSEHQSGYAMDLNSVSDSFANTKEGRWINLNAYKYGFILRYPKGKESITGYKYEPWHLRYVGTELSEVLYNYGDWITMEEYFGITSKY